MQDNIIQVSMYLSIIVGLILCGAYLLKKMKTVGFQTQGPIRIVASLSLGLKEKLVLIQIGDKQQILLGVSPEKIEKIQSFDEAIVRSDEADLDTFQDKLKEIMTQSPN
ncbi:MAG: flagellar biosynthetic protein FliO [Pseudomonadales bacterium]|nr:flagellar biosynthetic protein FliO [Pseudomonadales bacterium]